MKSNRKLIIATRKSPLALWQANTVKSILVRKGFDVELNQVTTSGDKMQRGALADVSLDDPSLPAHLKTGKGLFVKEVQEEILAERADLAVHSMKDLPVEATSGLRVAAVLPRANPSDVIIFSPRLLASISAKAKISGLPDDNLGAILGGLTDSDWSSSAPVGTTSARRQFFLGKTLSPAALPLVVLRGNVDTRLSRVANNEFSFIMLARAGIDRLGLYAPEKMLTLPPALCTPAPAQGIVAIECRDSDAELRSALSEINDPATSLAAACERTALWLTGGNCHTALAAYFDGRQLTTWAASGKHCCNLTFNFTADEAEEFKKFTLSRDHHDVFRHFLKSPAAFRMHGQLTERGFAGLMNLRQPESGKDGGAPC